MLFRPRRSEPFSAPTVLTAVVAVAVLFVGLHLVNVTTVDGRFFRIDQEQNLFTWISSVLFGLAAASSAAWAFAHGSARTPWVLLALLLSVLSIDEVAMVHERLESSADSRLSFLVLQPLLAACAVWLLVTIMRGIDRAERPLVAAAIAALCLAQAGSIAASELDLAGPVAAAQGIVEEVLELLVPGFVLAATLPRVGPPLAAALKTSGSTP